MATTEAVEARTQFIMTAADRCDGCGAQAYIRVTISLDKGPLQFCNHHWVHHEPILDPLAIDLLDERHHLLANDKHD